MFVSKSSFGLSILIAVAVGAAIGSVSAGAQTNWDQNAMLLGAGIGAASGAIGFGLGSIATSAAVKAGLGAAASSIFGGTVGGTAAGVTSTAMYGGDVGKGALYGAIGGAAFGAINVAYGDNWSFSRVAVTGFSGGGISELSGGDFAQGFLFAAAPVAARGLYGSLVKYEPAWEKGGEAVEKGKLDMPVKGANNIGTQGQKPNPKGWINEGGRVSRFLNHVRGVNAIAGMHDVFQVKLERYVGSFARTALNIPGMAPAAAITFSALVTDFSPVINYHTSQGKRNRQ
jgi:hypothetical protein